MKSYKRLLLWVTGGLGVILLALLFTLTVVAPRVISSESVKSRIRNEFANAVGGSLDFDRLSIALFPSLGVVVHGASVTVPEKGRGTFETLQVYPRILPLFRGALRIGKLRISEPSFQLDLAKLPDLGKEKSESDTSRSLQERAA
ncbi:MAG: AsmA family protein, partial [Thermodesulfobacteriota bacterium]